MPVKKAEQAVPNHLLRLARLELALSQREVADRIGAPHSFMISRWEKGTASPGSQYQQRLCKLFKKTPEELGFLSETTVLPSPTPSIYDPVIYHPSKLTEALIGRDDLYQRLHTLLCDSDDAQTIALDGLPGVGKTTLIIRLLNDARLLEHFCDGILWCGLGNNPNVMLHLSRWANLLGVDEHDIKQASTPADLHQILRARIGQRHMLVVIDDTWSIEDAWSCHIGSPHCSYLLTTRFSDLAVQFGGPHTFHVEELSEDDGVRLLHQISPTIVEEEPQEIHTLVRNVGGLPLALTLIGRYLLIQARFNQRRRLITALQRFHSTQARLNLEQPIESPNNHPSLADEKSISLKAVIGLSEETLDDSTRKAFYTLSLFPPKPNTFSEEAALFVSGTGPETLDLLVDVGFLESHSGSRYTMHQTISDYARLHNVETAPLHRFVSHYIDFLHQHKTAYTQIETEIRNIFAALGYARQQHYPLLYCEGICAFASFLGVRGRYDIAIQYLEIARNLLQPSQNTDLYTQLLHRLGSVHERKGNYVQAEHFLQEALHYSRQTHDEYRIARIIVSLVLCLERRGAYDDITCYLTEGFQLAARIKNPTLYSELLTLQAQDYIRRGQYEQAEKTQREGLEYARQGNDPEHIAGLLINVAVTQEKREEYQEAGQSLQEARRLAVSIGNNDQLCLILSNLGSILTYLNQDDEAEKALLEGKKLAERINSPMFQASIISNLGSIAQKHHDYQKAESYLLEGLEIATHIGYREMIAWLHSELGELYIQQENEQEAQHHFLLAQELSTEPDVLASSAYALARIALAKQRYADAYRYGRQSLSLYRQLASSKEHEVQTWLDTLQKEKIFDPAFIVDCSEEAVKD